MSSIQKEIEKKLKGVFSPTYIKVKNLSSMHAGHVGDDGSGESHFSIDIVSASFEGVGRIDRQRMVYDALSDEMKIIHALTVSGCSTRL